MPWNLSRAQTRNPDCPRLVYLFRRGCCTALGAAQAREWFQSPPFAECQAILAGQDGLLPVGRIWCSQQGLAPARPYPQRKPTPTLRFDLCSLRPDLRPTISFDASSTVGPRTGVGVYTASLLNSLVEELPEGWQLRVWVNSPRHPLPDDPWVRSSRAEVRYTRWSGKAILHSWRWLRTPKIERFVDEVSLHHSPAGYPTPTRNARRVLSVHDLFFRQLPASHDPYGGGYFHRTYRRSLPLQDALICFSAATREDILRAYHIPPASVRVIPHGVRHDIFHPATRRDEADTLHQWTQGEPYLLSVGTLGPRKNVPLLVEAYAQLRREVPQAPRLLLVGHAAPGPLRDALQARLRDLDVHRHVVMMGYVPDSQIPVLYRHAMAFVFPSLDEGFGLPVLEAMACGCPVITSTAGALPEVAGDAALLVPPTDREALAASLRQLVEQPTLRTRLRAAGLSRAAQFTWPTAARSTVEAYREVLARERQ